MSNSRLTRDNPLLSRLKRGEFTGSKSLGAEDASAGCVINYTDLPAEVVAYVAQGLTENTQRAYTSDLEHFEAWGGSIPASDTMVASYLAAHAETLAIATLCRRLATISKAHAAKGLVPPTACELVRATLRGIKRSRGTAQIEAMPLLRDDLFSVLQRMGDTTRDVRDRALLLIGFAGAFRRSELIGIDVEDVEHVRQGIIVRLRRSKTDQEGAGRRIGIPYGRSKWCPVKHLAEWLDHAEIENGPLFRSVNRHGHVSKQRLSGEAVCMIIRERAAAAGFDPTCFSGHSLRAGLVTAAITAGASAWKIRQQTGHASDVMLSRYIRDRNIFDNNAAGAVL